MTGVNVKRVGDWTKASVALKTTPIRLKVAMDRAVMQEGQFFRRKVVEGFREESPGGKDFKPLSEWTLAVRRFQGISSTQILTVHADLRNSVKVVKQRHPLGVGCFVGVLKTARDNKGNKLVNIAKVHEHGSRPFIIPVTPAMRKFLMAVASKEMKGQSGSGSGTMSQGFIVVQIPARPFLKPVAEKWFDGPDAAARFQKRIIQNLGGAAGVVSGGGSGKIKTKSSLFQKPKGPPARDPTTGRFVKRNTDF